MEPGRLQEIEQYLAELDKIKVRYNLTHGTSLLNDICLELVVEIKTLNAILDELQNAKKT